MGGLTALLSACAGRAASTGSDARSTLTSTDARPRVGTAYVPSLHATILVDGSGYPLYVFAPDDRRSVTCRGACTHRWPPLRLTSGETPVAGPGVDAHLLGVDRGPAGDGVVTYHGWPLYGYVTDRKLGLHSAIAGGAGLDVDGGYWFVIRPDGDPIVHRLSPVIRRPGGR